MKTLKWSGLNYKAILNLITFINIHDSCDNNFRITDYKTNSKINSHVKYSMSFCLDLKQNKTKKSPKPTVLKGAPNAVLLKTCCLFPFWGWVASFSKHSLLLLFFKLKNPILKFHTLCTCLLYTPLFYCTTVETD